MGPEDADDHDADDDIPTFSDMVEAIEGDAADCPDTPTRDRPSPRDDRPDSGESDTWQWVGDDDTASEAAESTAIDGFGGISSSKVAAILDLIGDRGNVLVVGPAGTPAEDDLCARLIGSPEGHHRNRLLVTIDRTPDERLSVLRGYGSGAFETTAVVAVGDEMRSCGRATPVTQTLGQETLIIECIHDARDLTRIGLLLNKYLGRLTDDDLKAVVCVDSLTALVPYLEMEQLFRFLHVLLGRIRLAGARAHFHLDADACSDEELETIAQVFDFTLRFEATGDLTIKT